MFRLNRRVYAWKRCLLAKLLISFCEIKAVISLLKAKKKQENKRMHAVMHEHVNEMLRTSCQYSSLCHLSVSVWDCFVCNWLTRCPESNIFQFSLTNFCTTWCRLLYHSDRVAAGRGERRGGKERKGGGGKERERGEIAAEAQLVLS